MTVPYREWFAADFYTMVATDPNGNSYDVLTDWDNSHNPGQSLVGARRNNNEFWASNTRWAVLVKPKSGFSLESGAEALLSFQYKFSVSLYSNTAGSVSCSLFCPPLDDPTSPSELDLDKITGRYYDGATVWDHYPHGQATSFRVDPVITVANLPETREGYVYSWWLGFGGVCYVIREKIFRCGIELYLSSIDNYGSWSMGDELIFNVVPQYFKARYFDPIVNSISPQWMINPGDSALVLTGIAFKLTDAECNLYASGAGTTWNEKIKRIQFVGNQGQGTFTIDNPSHFTVTTNQLTIHAATFPVLPIGTYDILIWKENNVLGVNYVSAYAGDWSAGSDGRMSRGQRIKFAVGPAYSPGGGGGGPLLLTKWAFSHYSGDIFKYYAKIDTRSRTAGHPFYDGRILQASALKTEYGTEGLVSVSNIDISLAQPDSEFSKLLYLYEIANKLMSISACFPNDSMDNAFSIMTLACKNMKIRGPVFSASFYDFTEKYLNKLVPEKRITEADYPNLHDTARNQPMPDILGLNVLAGDCPGATEALYVNTVDYEYIAAGASIPVLTVYSDGTTMTEGAGNDYVIEYRAGGVTFICFNADQGDNKITFDSGGYILDPWDSANGYIQNPAYVAAFFMALIAKVPVELIDLDSVDECAAWFEARGWEESGRLIIKDVRNAREVLKELLFTFGIMVRKDTWGRFVFEILDVKLLDADLIIFQQIEGMDWADKDFDTARAINKITAYHDHYPSLDIFTGDDFAEDTGSQDALEVECEPKNEPLKFPWTTSAGLVSHRMADILDERSFGENPILVKIPMEMINDVELGKVFRFQDPYGLSADGEGEKGHYYFITGISYNWDEEIIEITGRDLQWLVARYFVLGDRDVEPADFLNAGNNSMYGYLCDRDTGKFTNGKPGKMLIDRDLTGG